MEQASVAKAAALVAFDRSGKPLRHPKSLLPHLIVAVNRCATQNHSCRI